VSLKDEQTFVEKMLSTFICYGMTHRLERCLEDVVGKEVPAQVQKVIHDVDLPLLGLSAAQGHLRLGAARVDGQNEDEA
jgi:hypothetical protein